jgi:hypothetical protein
MPLRVTINSARIETTNRFRTQSKRLFHQFNRAWAHQQSTLWKCNEINSDHVSQSLPRDHDTLDAGHSTVGVYVDMTSDKRAAMGDRQHRMSTGLKNRINRQCLPHGALVLDLVDQASTNLIAIPW